MTEQTEGAEVEALAEELHRAFHDAWPGPSVPLDLYADSPIWRSQARIVAAREAAAEARGAQAVLAAVEAYADSVRRDSIEAWGANAALHAAARAAACGVEGDACEHPEVRHFRDMTGGHDKCLACGRIVPPAETEADS